MSGEVQNVCPQPEDLTVGAMVTCPVEGCGRQFESSSHLQMHVVRHHHGRPLEKDVQGVQAFYCPVEDCERSRLKGKPFPRMGQLKQVRDDILIV